MTSNSYDNNDNVLAAASRFIRTTMATVAITEGVNSANDESSLPGVNVSVVWSQAEVRSVGERARLVLGQPVAILCLTLCVLSLLANLLSISATLLGPNTLTTHLKLVVSLGLSDMTLGLSTLSHLLNRILLAAPAVNTPPQHRLAFACASTFHFALNTMAVLISLLNLLAMAVDHYVAIMNPLHYPSRLSRAKGNVVIAVIWGVAFLGGCSVFLADVDEYRRVSRHINYCEYVQYSDYQGEYLVFAVAFITFFVVTFTYGRIYMEVRRSAMSHGVGNGVSIGGAGGARSRSGAMASRSGLDYARNRKALLTTLLIICTFVFCWLPTCLFQVALLIQVQVDKVSVQRLYATFLRANRYLNALFLLNALFDPAIYACRLRHVQLGYRRLFRACLCLSRHKPRLTSFRSSVHHTQVAQVSSATSIRSRDAPTPAKRSPVSDPLSPDPLLEAEAGQITPLLVCSSYGGEERCQHHHQEHCQRVCKGTGSPDVSPEALCVVCNVMGSDVQEDTSRV